MLNICVTHSRKFKNDTKCEKNIIQLLVYGKRLFTMRVKHSLRIYYVSDLFEVTYLFRIDKSPY